MVERITIIKSIQLFNRIHDNYSLFHERIQSGPHDFSVSVLQFSSFRFMETDGKERSPETVPLFLAVPVSGKQNHGANGGADCRFPFRFLNICPTSPYNIEYTSSVADLQQYTAGKSNLPGACGNHRTGFRRRKKTRVAIYRLTGQSQRDDAGFAHFRPICSQFDYSHEKRRLGLNPKRRFVYRLELEKAYAFPAQPRTVLILCSTSALMAARPSPRYWRGSK